MTESTYAIASPQADKFWSRVDQGQANDCWLWLGSNDGTGGYGRFYLGRGRWTYAHRLALALTKGEDLAPGAFACHRCDNPPCCNPSHLFEGSVLDNNRDMLTKGRGTFRLGYCARGHELTPENAIPKRAGSRTCRICERAGQRRRWSQLGTTFCEPCGKLLGSGNFSKHLATPTHARNLAGWGEGK